MFGLPFRHGRLVQRLLILAALLGVGGAVAAVSLQQRDTQDSSDRGSLLEPAADRLDFGEVWEDSAFNWSLPVANQSGRDIKIAEFRTSCACSRIEPKSLLVPAGQSREINLTLDLSSKDPSKVTLPLREFEVLITPVLLDAMNRNRPMSWIVRGRVREAIRSDVPYVDFGTFSELAQPIAPRRLTITSLTPLRNLTASCSSPHFELQVQRHTEKDASEFDLIIAPRGPLPRGQLRFAIFAVPELSEGKRLPAKKLEATGLVMGDVEAHPPNVNLGACPVGTTVNETITLRSLTKRAFVVLDAKCNGSGLSIKRVQNETSTGATFVVTQLVQGAGTAKGTVIFAVRSEGKESEEVVLPVALCGIAAERQ